MAFQITGPEGPIRFGDPEHPELLFVAAENVGPVQWSVDLGAMETEIGDSSLLSPPNLSTIVTVTGKDTGADPWTVATAQLVIEATLPVQGNFGVESDIDDTPPEISVPEKGEPKFRESESMTASWPYVFTSRMFQEWASIRAFLMFHRYSIPFWVEDMATGELVRGYRDSSVRRKPLLTNLWEYSFRFKTYNYIPPAGAAAVGPWAELGDSGDYGGEDYGG